MDPDPGPQRPETVVLLIKLLHDYYPPILSSVVVIAPLGHLYVCLHLRAEMKSEPEIKTKVQVYQRAKGFVQRADNTSVFQYF